MYLFGFLSVVIILVVAVQTVEVDSSKIFLRSVETLSLEKEKMTSNRRENPIPQSKCVGGSAGCSVNQPSTVQCYNTGHDGHDIQWECKAELDGKYKFGKIQVSCEGYDYPDDPYILTGSCGLEYELDLTEYGEQKQTEQAVVMAVVLVILALLLFGCLARGCGDNKKLEVPQMDSQPDFGGTPYSPPYTSSGFGGTVRR